MIWVLLMIVGCGGKDPECPDGLEWYDGFCVRLMGEDEDPWFGPDAGGTEDTGAGETGDTGDTGETGGETGEIGGGETGDTGDTGGAGGDS